RVFAVVKHDAMLLHPKLACVYVKRFAVLEADLVTEITMTLFLRNNSSDMFEAQRTIGLIVRIIERDCMTTIFQRLDCEAAKVHHFFEALFRIDAKRSQCH